MFTKIFQKIDKNDPNSAGGKGASLGEMTNAGIPVPPGFVLLADAFERFLEETDLNVEIDAILHTVNHREIHTVEGASEKIEALILEAKMPKDIADEIKAQFKKLNAKFVAVRSSATAEDGATAAWAGQLDSFLNTTEKELLHNVQRCWASLLTPRAIFYRFEKGLHKTKISVAVVVQKMVESEVSGIAFSVHPVTEDRNQLIIEAGFGLGEAIVSGQITPDSYVVEKTPRRIIDKNISEQERGLYRASLYLGKVEQKGGNEWKGISKEHGGTQKLSDEQILELSELVLHIENHYGFPSDIEWAFAKGKFYILQSRPITTLSSEKPSLIGSSNERTEEWMAWIWPGLYWYQVIHPMFAWQQDFKEYGLSIAKLVVTYSKGTSAYYFVRREYEEEGRKLFEKVKKDSNLLASVLEKINTAAEEIFELGEKWKGTDFSSLSDKELIRHHRLLFSFDEPLWRNGQIPNLLELDNNYLSEHVKSILEEKYGIGRAQELFTILTTSTFESKSEKEQFDFLTLLKQYKNLDSVAKQKIQAHWHMYMWMTFGWAGPALSYRYFEEMFKNAIKTRSHFVKEIEEKIEIKRKLLQQQKEILNEILSRDRLFVVLLRKILEAKARRVDAHSLTYFLAEKMMKEIGKRVGLSINQMRIVIPSEVPKLFKIVNVEKINDEYERVLIWFENGISKKYTGTSAEKKLKYVFDRLPETLDTEELKGQLAYPGKVKGNIKVILDIKDAKKFQEGEILVTRMTDPSYVPLMKVARAIVTDIGGITCHAAIVAREMRKPCIIGTKIATKVLKDGDMVEVDANEGVVRILRKA